MNTVPWAIFSSNTLFLQIDAMLKAKSLPGKVFKK
jgi:hypothetical protein